MSEFAVTLVQWRWDWEGARAGVPPSMPPLPSYLRHLGHRAGCTRARRPAPAWPCRARAGPALHRHLARRTGSAPAGSRGQRGGVRLRLGGAGIAAGNRQRPPSALGARRSGRGTSRNRGSLATPLLPKQRVKAGYPRTRPKAMPIERFSFRAPHRVGVSVPTVRERHAELILTIREAVHDCLAASQHGLDWNGLGGLHVPKPKRAEDVVTCRRSIGRCVIVDRNVGGNTGMGSCARLAAASNRCLCARSPVITSGGSAGSPLTPMSGLSPTSSNTLAPTAFSGRRTTPTATIHRRTSMTSRSSHRCCRRRRAESWATTRAGVTGGRDIATP